VTHLLLVFLGGVGLASLFFFEIFVYSGTVVVIWVVAVAFFCCFCGWVGVQIVFGCFLFVRRGERRGEELSFLFVLFVGRCCCCLLWFIWELGFFFSPSFGVKETKRKKSRRRRRRRRESMQ
jgi:hypothetical protein